MAEINARAATGRIVGLDVNVSESTAVHGLGERFSDHLGREWIYARANGAVTGQGYTVALDTTNDATLLTTAIANTLSRFMGVTGTNGAPADNDYFWVCLSKPPGDATLGIWTEASAAADAQLYTTATAGQLDTTTANAPIDHVRLLTATGGSAAANATSEWHYMTRGLAGT